MDINLSMSGPYAYDVTVSWGDGSTTPQTLFVRRDHFTPYLLGSGDLPGSVNVHCIYKSE